MILTRTLSKDELGTWGVFLIVTGIFEMTKTNLLKNAHIRFVTANRDEAVRISVASCSFVINACLNLIFIILIIAFSGQLSRWLNLGDGLATMLWWFIPGLILMTIFSHLEAVQLSHMDFKGVFAGHFVRQVFFFLVLVIHALLRKPLSLSALAIYQSVSICFGGIVLYVCTRKYLLNKFNFSLYWTRQIFGYGGYIFGSGVVSNISTNLDQLMIAKFIPGSVAYYNVASRINNLIDMPSYAAADIIFPKTSVAIVEESPERVKYLFEKMVGILLAVSIPIAAVILIFPKMITVIVAGNEYTAAATILQIYMISGILRPAQNQAANLLNSIGKPGLTFVMNTITLLLMVSINYFLLKKIGFYGAAIGTLITTLIGFILWYLLMRKQIRFEFMNVYRFMLETYSDGFKKLKSMLQKGKPA